MTTPNLDAVINTIKNVFPNGEHLGKIKAQRKLNTTAVLTALALSDADELEGKGVYVSYEFTQNNMLVTVYIGLYGIGIIACYYAANDEWHECQSHGNYGKNCASGGNWSVTNKSTNPPECVKNLIKTL